MTEANENEKEAKGGGTLSLGGGGGAKKPLTVSRPSKLELKKTVDAGQVRQSFSHGRSKAVSVEVRRKRTFQQGEGGVMTEIKDAPILEAEEALAPAVVEEAPPVVDATPTAPIAPPRTLTESERAARARALKGAKISDEQQRRVEEEERRFAEEESARLAREDEKRRQADEEAKRIAAEAARMAEEEKAKLASEAAARPRPDRCADRGGRGRGHRAPPSRPRRASAAPSDADPRPRRAAPSHRQADHYPGDGRRRG
jgi:translation initiation factor IF-2